MGLDGGYPLFRLELLLAESLSLLNLRRDEEVVFRNRILECDGDRPIFEGGRGGAGAKYKAGIVPLDCTCVDPGTGAPLEGCSECCELG